MIRVVQMACWESFSECSAGLSFCGVAAQGACMSMGVNCSFKMIFSFSGWVFAGDVNLIFH
jgi:hypothetical protein